MKNKLTLLFLFFLFANSLFSQNLITNGGFELGGSGIGFVTNGAGYTLLNSPYSGTTTTGNFAIASNPKLVNTTNFISDGDHTSGTGKMLLFDCGTTTSNASFWKAGNTGTGVTGLTIGTTYYFSYWIKSISNQVTTAATSANITFTTAPTGATLPVLLSGSALAPLPALGWRQVIYSFTATSTTLTLDLKNSTSSATGNDFAVDDFMLTDDLMISYVVTNAVCATGNNGAVNVSGFGGSAPYVSYSITGPGPTNITNATGNFTNLQPGIYTVSVTDSALPLPATATLTNVVVGPAITITTSTGTTICSGTPITLTAAGSTAAYSWTAFPADPTLTTPNSASPTVTPITTTAYTVTSTIGSCAPISSSVTVTVNPLPTATISGTTAICSGTTTVITFTGTPNATVTYKINGGPNQTIVLDVTGNATLTTPAITLETTYALVNVISAAPASCTQTVVGFAKISVNVQLGITATPNPICVGGISKIKATANTFLQSSGGVLNPMIGATTIVNSSVDNTPSGATNIGFNFNFGGTTYTQCSVSPDGWLLLGGALAGSQPVNLTLSPQNTPKLYPFWDDMATGIDGNVKVLVTGVAPNRIFIVEWNVTVPKNIAGPSNSTFQVWLNETTNVIEYHYGAIGAQTSNSISAGYTVSSTNFSSITFSSNTASTLTQNDVNNTVPIIGTTYTYTPLTSLIWSPTANLFTDPSATIAYTGDSRDIVYATNLSLVGATYTVTGINPAGCTASTSVTISVSSPTANIAGNSTICPGNTAVITITGTPSSSVTLMNNLGNTYAPFIPASGTLLWTTPILSATTVYNLVSIKNFATGCQTNYTGITVTITVVPNGCATVGTIPGPTSLPLDLTLCTSGECRNIQANISNVPSTSTYAATSIPYCPYPFTDPSYNVVPITSGDDFWSDVINLPFNFCFYGQNYISCNAGTNGLLTFVPKTPGSFCPWPDTSIPISGQNQSQSIFGVYQDTDMGIPPSAPDRQVNWVLQGTYPCRKLIVNFYNLGQWNSTATNPGLQTSQIVLYEVSNIIEVFVQRRVAGAPWSGSGAIGLIGGSAAQWVAAPGRNTGNWSVTTVPEAWRFTPTGPPVSVVINWLQGMTPIGTGANITVCPTTTTTYTANAVYNVCGVAQTATTSVTLNVNPDLTNAPLNINQCTNTFDLTTNTSVILGALNPSDYDITYHTSAADAATISNPITTPTAFVSSGTGQTIYAAIYVNAFGCTVVKQFNLIISCITPVPDLTLCESTLGSGSADFDLTPQTAIALTNVNPVNFTINYYLSQAAANAGTPGTEISPINHFIGTNQTIYIRMQENANPANYYTEHFNLIVIPKANAGVDGSINICDNDFTPINLYSIITGEQTGGTWIRTTGAGGIFNAAAGTFTPSAGTTTSTFTYTITGVAPCSNDDSLATINIIPNVSAGTDGGIVICAFSPTPIDLFSLITGETNGGTWIRNTGTGGIFNAAAATFAPTAGATTSTFTYTVPGVTPCGPDSSLATVTIGSQPDAGVDGGTVVCETSLTAIDLFGLITGEQPGGVWTQATGTGGTFNAVAGTFTPAVGATSSSFTYTISGVAPCITDTSLASVSITAQPTAGIDGGTVVCETSITPIDLFSLITGEQTGGTWVRSTGTGGTFNAVAGTYTPAIGATTSTFTYTVSGVAPCVNDSSIATITINAQPNAGIDGGTIVCETSGTAINLSSLITGEQAGGVWTRSSGTGGTFNAAAGTFTSAVGATSSTFTYTLTGTAPCINDTSLATVTINPQPTAGVDGGTVICENSIIAVDLFSLITGEAVGGTWVRTTGTGGTFNAAAGTYTPAIGATTSTFTYTVTGVAPCIADSSVATITINTQPTAGVDGGTIVCETSVAAINLFSLITGEQAGGTWTQTSGTGGIFNAVAGTFTPAIGATTSTFTYTVSGIAPCINDTSLATITINAQPNAGVDGGTVLCETSATTVDLFSLITGEQVGGTWVRTTGTGGIFNAVAGTFTPAVGATTSTFTYTLTGVAPCINDSSIATITINPQPTAGIDGGTTICENNSSPINLYTLITGEQAGGTWIRTTGTGGAFNAATGTFTPAVGVTTSTFTYAVTGTAPCINDSSIATITVNPLPTATIFGTRAVCLNSVSPQIILTCADATAPYTFTYSINTVVQPPITTISGNSVSINVPTAPQGVYTYALVNVQDAGSPACSQAQTGSAVITVNTAPTINNPSPYLVCDDSLNNDGLYCFDLTTKINEITGGNSNIVVDFYETTTSGVSLSSPYCNITPGLQILNVRAHFIGSPTCLSTTSLNLVVNPIPLPNPVITDYELCDYNNPGDGFEVFNLGTKSAEIANGQSGVTVTYYDNLADAQAQTNTLPNLYPNTTNPQKIWINIRDNATGCNTTGSFNLIVHPLPVVSTAPTLFECSNGSSPTAEFDLRINEGTVTNGVSGLIVTYYNTLLDAQNGSPSIASPSTYIGTDNEVVYLRVENTATGCYATTTQLLRVTQGPVAITPQPLHYCDPNNDGFGVFDLDSTINEISGGILPPGVSVTFHETPTDALLGANPIASPYTNIHINTQTIYVRVYYTLTGCANYVELQLIINPTPVATEPAAYELCDYRGAVGYETFDLNTRIPEILGSLNPTTHVVTFYTSQTDAESGTGNIPNPGNYINGTVNTETIYVRVEIIATGCYDIVTLQLIVNPLPIATQPNYLQYSLCDTTGLVGFETFDLASRVNSILLGQAGMDVTFYPSLSDAQNGTNVITDLQYTNVPIYVQTLGIRITNHATGCYVISTMDIRVEPLPVLIPPTAPYTICDDDQDGVSCGFDLTTLLPGLLNGIITYTVTFHETLPDANNNANAINTSVPYCSINPFVQILYVRAQDNATGCYSILPIELNADPSPVAPVNLDPITVCDQDSNPQSASTIVDLTQETAAVLAQQTGAAVNYTVMYYKNQGDAQVGTNVGQIITPSSYFGSNLEMIWVRVEHNTTHCYNIGSFQLKINTPLLLTTPAPLSLCDYDTNSNDQHHAFNLTVKDVEINQATGYAVTYYASLLDAQNNTNAISATAATAYVNIVPAVQTLGVVVTTPAGCKSITTLDIRVLPIPTPNTNPRPLAPQCDDNNPGDMMEVFNLTVNAAYIANGDPNVTLHYYNSQLDASVPQNEIATPTTALVGGNVWIRVENNRVDYQGNHCYVLVEQPLTVNPLPTVVQPLPSYRVCDNNADGIAVFDLTNPLLAPMILGTITTNQQPSDYTISYYLTAAGANPMTNTGETPLLNSYTNVTPNAQDIYIRVVNNATSCVNPTGVLRLTVEAYATATGPQTFKACDNYADLYDGVGLIDLTTYAPAILNGQDPAVFLVSYYRSLAAAQAGTNALTLAEAQAYQTHANTDTIWVKVENSSNLITPVCYAITTIDITVEPYPNPVIATANNVTTICVDFVTNEVVRPLTLNSGITNPGNYTFEWLEGGVAIPGATGASYTVDTPATAGATRDYTVTVTSASPQACQTTSAPFPVIQSGQAIVPAGTTGYTVTNAFSSSQIITVIIEGYGAPDYQFSLDDGPRQTSNVFEGVSLGSHIIHVWDNKGDIAYSCEELIIDDVQIIDYPHYFTPNGDGMNDTWNIVGLDTQHGAKIYIFDRYGKLLKQISSTGLGWDGTYNGHLMPSDDYWFTVDYLEGTITKQFKAHFAMKR